jgi:hypothetical protein
MTRKATTTTKGVPARIKTAAIKGVEQGKTFASVEKALIAKGVKVETDLYQMIRRAAIEHYGSVEAVKAAKGSQS